HKPVHALLESALTVFERKVKCIAHNWLGFAEHEAPRRYGNANIKGEEGFPNLRLAREHCYALGNEVGQDDAHWLELFRMQGLCCDPPVPPCLAVLLCLLGTDARQDLARVDFSHGNRSIHLPGR